MPGEDWSRGGFGLYIHWPFCQSKCPYCDFNSHVSQSVDQTDWMNAYLREIDRVAEATPGRTLQSVFFGGGTPSLMDPRVVDGILHKVSNSWRLSNNCEITLEANPGSVEVGRFQAYRSAGVNRVSLGVQSLNDADLRRLGRGHSAAEARSAIDIARSTFDRVSFDLIYARQDQSLTDWETELTEALTLAADHLSLYQLTIEDGTVFGDRFARGMLRGLPDEDKSADMFNMTQQMCNDAGMPAYEVSNHARVGSESRHNIIYWTAGDYLGIGPGAHGRVTQNGIRWATECARLPGDWLKRTYEGRAETVRYALPKEEQALEYLIMGLRVVDGIDMDRYHLLNGRPLNSQQISDLLDLGLIELTGRHLCATESGRLLLNRVITELSMP